ncbi:MAG TPA: DgsA anti-repressor MtfA [Cytophagales bacterium]|nr:DgsA anti-repressor MtfA [Cytophagales bacterium]HAA20181.1 DgsA anti-repressor MtfA [Cytophagales bacterium]HAP58927.1 DgsA anti-repressor MtfA [Cytophagales bacterium]
MDYLFLLAPLAIVLVIVVGFFKIFRDIYRHFQGSIRENAKVYLLLGKHYREPIEKYFPYYQRLNETEKARFRHRVALFIRTKKFLARGGLERVTPEMIALISATAVMLSFGMELIYFRSFERILIYPTDYYSKINQAYHKGEVNPRLGIIIISWEHFVKGLIDDGDGINLGVHELAHAFHLEDRIISREYDYLHTGLLAYWTNHARWEMEKIASGNDHLFRPYAATNEEEFFAVALENFFERPAEFRDDLPQLYNILTRLIRQDPAEGMILG